MNLVLPRQMLRQRAAQRPLDESLDDGRPCRRRVRLRPRAGRRVPVQAARSRGQSSPRTGQTAYASGWRCRASSLAILSPCDLTAPARLRAMLWSASVSVGRLARSHLACQ